MRQLIILMMLIVLHVNVCTAAEKDHFRAVPFSERNRLVDRLKVLIQYEQSQQWERLYNLMYNPKETLQAFIARKQKIPTRIVSFNPIEVFFIEREESWGIIGCAETTEPTGKRQRMEMATDAKIKNGEWYFSDIGIVIHHDHIDSCK